MAKGALKQRFVAYVKWDSDDAAGGERRQAAMAAATPG